jgi:hypothetical protein
LTASFLRDHVRELLQRGRSTNREEVVNLMSDTTSVSGAPDRRWLILGVIGLAQLMVVLDITVMNIALLVSSGVFCLVYGLSNAATHSWRTPSTYGFLAAAVVLVVAFAAGRVRDAGRIGRDGLAGPAGPAHRLCDGRARSAPRC